MNQIIKDIIEETFKSKKQQRYFYSKANDQSLSPKKRNQWRRWATEFSNNTNFKKLPEVAEDEEQIEMDEIVDENGNFISGTEPRDASTKYVGSKSTTDQVVHSAMPQIGTFGIAGGGINKTLKYWAESDMSKALGAKDTILQDASYEDAKDHMEGDLNIPEPEAEERLEDMGYDPNLPDGKLRLVENPKKFIEEYIENLLQKKTRDSEILEKDEENVEINPIIKKQIDSLKQSITNNNVSINQVIKYLSNKE